MPPRFVRNGWIDVELYENGVRHSRPSFGPKTVDGEATLKIWVRKNGKPVKIGCLVIGPNPYPPGDVIEVAFYPDDSKKTKKTIYRGKR